MNQLESAGLTDIGRKRKMNQDAFLVNDSAGLYIVADGIGGHRAGEVASRMAVQTIDKVFSGKRSEKRNKKEDVRLSTEAERLSNAINAANEKIYTSSCENSAFTGMGTTVSAIYFHQDNVLGNMLIGANVGDSPIYLVREKKIERLSVPHTMVREIGGVDSTGGDGLKHILSRAVGIETSVAADVFEMQCYFGDIIIIGSDGLSNKLENEELKDIVIQQAPQKACETLVNLANQRGGDDNITVIVVKVVSTKDRFFEKIKRCFSFFHL